jgi:hypothetical protein
VAVSYERGTPVLELFCALGDDVGAEDVGADGRHSVGSTRGLHTQEYVISGVPRECVQGPLPSEDGTQF